MLLTACKDGRQSIDCEQCGGNAGTSALRPFTRTGGMRSVQVKANPKPSPSPKKSIQRDHVTFEDVESAVRKLSKNGITAPLRSVHAELRTGSPSNVSSHISARGRSRESEPVEGKLNPSPSGTQALWTDTKEAKGPSNGYRLVSTHADSYTRGQAT